MIFAVQVEGILSVVRNHSVHKMCTVRVGQIYGTDAQIADGAVLQFECVDVHVGRYGQCAVRLQIVHIAVQETGHIGQIGKYG